MLESSRPSKTNQQGAVLTSHLAGLVLQMVCGCVPKAVLEVPSQLIESLGWIRGDPIGPKPHDSGAIRAALPLDSL